MQSFTINHPHTGLEINDKFCRDRTGSGQDHIGLAYPASFHNTIYFPIKINSTEHIGGGFSFLTV